MYSAPGRSENPSSQKSAAMRNLDKWHPPDMAARDHALGIILVSQIRVGMPISALTHVDRLRSESLTECRRPLEPTGIGTDQIGRDLGPCRRQHVSGLFPRR